MTRIVKQKKGEPEGDFFDRLAEVIEEIHQEKIKKASV